MPPHRTGERRVAPRCGPTRNRPAPPNSCHGCDGRCQYVLRLRISHSRSAASKASGSGCRRTNAPRSAAGRPGRSGGRRHTHRRAGHRDHLLDFHPRRRLDQREPARVTSGPWPAHPLDELARHAPAGQVTVGGGLHPTRTARSMRQLRIIPNTSNESKKPPLTRVLTVVRGMGARSPMLRPSPRRRCAPRAPDTVRRSRQRTGIRECPAGAARWPRPVARQQLPPVGVPLPWGRCHFLVLVNNR